MLYPKNRKRMIVTLLVAAGLVGLAATSHWWAPVVLRFFGANSAVIQALTAPIGVLVAIASLTVAILGLRRPTEPPPVDIKRPTEPERPSVFQPPPLLVPNPLGRDREIERAVELLRQRTSIAITGIVGVGKTTVLSIAVRRLWSMGNHPYTDTLYHRIAETGSEEERLGQVLLRIISIDPDAQVASAELEAKFAQARKLISGRTVLFSIDNADDIESLNVVKRVIENLPQLTLAITSRRIVWQDIPSIELTGVSAYEGVRLFEQKNGKRLADEDKQAVEELCDHYQGHPMMIWHMANYAERSGVSPQYLIRNLPSLDIDRDLSLRIDSIWSHIADNCRRALDVVGILNVATLRVDLATEVAEVSIDDLKRMEDECPLYLDRDVLHRDLSRFTVHESLRTWCRVNLESNRETSGGRSIEDLRVKIARFYIKLVKNSRLEKAEDLREIDDEWPNILGLIDNLSDPALALSLVDETIGDHFDDPNGYVPRRKQTISLLDRRNRILNCATEVGGLLAARVEKNLGHFAYWRGNHEMANELFLRARDRYKAGKDVAGEITTTWLLGYLADDENRFQEAESLYRAGTDLAEQRLSHDHELVPGGHHLIGCTLYHQGRFHEAETEFRRARRLVDERTSPHLLIRIERRLGSVDFELGRLDEAERRFRAVLALIERVERPRDGARIYRHLGVLELKRGNLEKAETFLEQALSVFLEMGAQRGQGYTLHGMAILRQKQGRLAEARDMCQQSLDIAMKTKSLYGQAAAYEELANILAAMGAVPAEVNRQRHHAFNIYSVIGHQKAERLLARLKEAGAMNPKLPEPIKGVLFDLMDTLADLDAAVYAQTHQGFADRLGVSLERFNWAWASSRDKSSTGTFNTTEARIRWVAKALETPPVEEGQWDEMVLEEEALWKKNVKLQERAVPLLQSLNAAGMRIAIVSNGPVAMLCLKDALGVSSLVTAFVLSSEVGVTKPGQLIYVRALELIGLQAGECVFVGDGNDRELDGAMRAGMYAIKVKRPRAPYADPRNESLDWDFEVNDLEELGGLFESRTRRTTV